ncbi:hypothetical protein H2201_004792 [Coniosporium apollinis]|uniref:CFEM domain-containing protein n=2 Tax=Coniosporium TaxID=2810619 RepID=A0ABQ9NRT7_9PEZI|nr:hypothetical protein H2199_004780 [Cladosporium sp. JES 115]KAJ9665132.1 hypothetical protein H2201_004792 [Coniosporium apollinis]
MLPRAAVIPVIFYFLIRLSASATVTLAELPAYQSQRNCAKYCFFVVSSGQGPPNEVARHLSCAVDPIENDCFCRPDLQAQADSYIKSCVGNACTRNALDISSATQVYNDYCTSAGFQRAEVTASTPTSDTTIKTTTGATQAPATITPSSSGSSSSSGKDEEKLGTGEIVGIIVGTLGFIATVAGAWFSYKALKNKRHVHPESSYPFQQYSQQQHFPIFQPNAWTSKIG